MNVQQLLNILSRVERDQPVYLRTGYNRFQIENIEVVPDYLGEGIELIATEEADNYSTVYMDPEPMKA